MIHYARLRGSISHFWGEHLQTHALAQIHASSFIGRLRHFLQSIILTATGNWLISCLLISSVWTSVQKKTTHWNITVIHSINKWLVRAVPCHTLNLFTLYYWGLRRRCYVNWGIQDSPRLDSLVCTVFRNDVKGLLGCFCNFQSPTRHESEVIISQRNWFRQLSWFKYVKLHSIICPIYEAIQQ